MGVAMYKRVQSCRIRWSARQFRKRPLLSLGGAFLVVCFACCDVAQAAQRQLDRNAAELCRDVPDVACWVWLLSSLRGKFASLSSARRTEIAAELTNPAKEPFRKKSTRKVTLDSRRKEESRSWLELQQPWRRKRRERLERRRVARLTRASEWLRYHVYAACLRSDYRAPFEEAVAKPAVGVTDTGE